MPRQPRKTQTPEVESNRKRGIYIISSVIFLLKRIFINRLNVKDDQREVKIKKRKKVRKLIIKEKPEIQQLLTNDKKVVIEIQLDEIKMIMLDDKKVVIGEQLNEITMIMKIVWKEVMMIWMILCKVRIFLYII